ncbi:MAG TPA: hypothetical protein VFU41_14965 [Gemmatimonadales bacterium]|nr:hypothetical protein [Gemmatimonadales bacterium]
MKRFLWMLALVTAAPAAPALRAQTPDTSDTAQAQQLRQEIRQRWNARVRRDLDLSPDQAVKLQATEDRFVGRRRELAERQRAVNDGLRGQLRPGIAADPDSVRRLMDARERNRAMVAQLDREEEKEIGGYLNPVQHARYQMMREQLRRRIEQIREQRRARGQMLEPRRGMERPRQGRPPRRAP